MKTIKYLTAIAIMIASFGVIKAQNYNPIINYNLNGTPTNGIKIKTNIPFTNSQGMPTIIIEGYNYFDGKPIGLLFNWYIYENGFINHSISSFGAYTPEVKLSNENGKVVIFINDRKYFNRFSVRGFATGISETAAWFSGWSVADEALSGTSTTTLPYKNAVGELNFPSGVIKSNGNIGIGTINPQNKLDVNGTVHAKEVKVDMAGWADFVFQKDYELAALEEVEKHIQEKGHLPNIPSAKEVIDNGLSLGESQKLLLQKIEELTLYVIEQNKEIKQLKEKQKS